MNGKVLNSRQIYCGRAQKKKERYMELQRKKEIQRQERYMRNQGVNLYVKYLEEGFDDDKLAQEFSKFGNITSAKVGNCSLFLVLILTNDVSSDTSCMSVL